MLRLIVNEGRQDEEKEEELTQPVLRVAIERNRPELKLIAGGGRAVRNPAEPLDEILAYGFSS